MNIFSLFILGLEHNIHQLDHIRPVNLGQRNMAGTESTEDHAPFQPVFSVLRLVPSYIGLYLFDEPYGERIAVDYPRHQSGSDRFR